jgi:hypothetical protein
MWILFPTQHIHTNNHVCETWLCVTCYACVMYVSVMYNTYMWLLCICNQWMYLSVLCYVVLSRTYSILSLIQQCTRVCCLSYNIFFRNKTHMPMQQKHNNLLAPICVNNVSVSVELMVWVVWMCCCCHCSQLTWMFFVFLPPYASCPCEHSIRSNINTLQINLQTLLWFNWKLEWAIKWRNREYCNILKFKGHHMKAFGSFTISMPIQ